MQAFYAFSIGFKDWFKHANDDDQIDRLSRVYSVIICVIFAVFITTTPYIGDPVTCWTTGASQGHNDYVNTICWISNTYWLPLRKQIPQYVPSREELEINYYQWVPIILLLQGALFYVPRAAWRALRERTGLNLKRIIRTINETKLEEKTRTSTIKYLTSHFNDCLELDREYNKNKLSEIKGLISKWTVCLFCLGKRRGTALFNTYMFVKILYILNLVIQLLLIDHFLEGKIGGFYGFDIINNLRYKHAWRETGHLPRITMCDFEIRVLGNLHRHTVQCVLPQNLFNEKIYIFLWFWMFILAIVTCINFILWLFMMLISKRRYNFVKHYVRRMANLDDEMEKPRSLTDKERKILKKFIEEFLRIDGVFALRLIQHNTNELVFSGFIATLWNKYYEQHGKKDDHSVDKEGNPLNIINGSSTSSSTSKRSSRIAQKI